MAISNCPRFWVSRVKVINACSTYLIIGQLTCKTNRFCSPSLIDNSSLSNEIHSLEKIPQQIFKWFDSLWFDNTFFLFSKWIVHNFGCFCQWLCIQKAKTKTMVVLDSSCIAIPTRIIFQTFWRRCLRHQMLQVTPS